MRCPNCQTEIITRTSAQNRKLWPMLHDVATQIQWRVDGRLMHLSENDWKDMFTCTLRRHQRVAEGIDGGSIFLGSSTSGMEKQEFSVLIELISHFGAEHEVHWSEPALKAYERYREMA